MSQRVSKLADRPRFEAALLGLFATIGVLLAAMGIYGVIAFLVTQRTPEIGVRTAMGATRFDILELMSMQGLRMIAAGTLVGLVIAVVGSRDSAASYSVCGLTIRLVSPACACYSELSRALQHGSRLVGR